MKRERLVYIDVIRFLAMLLVILAHSCSVALIKRPKVPEWNVVNAIVVVTEIAVPLFFMISGSTILNSDKTYSLKYLFKHRLVKILVPFFVWSVISAYVVRILSGQIEFNDMWNSILQMYHKPVLEAYWFVYPLIALYLLSPLLKAMVDNISENLLNYLIVIWLIINILFPAVVKAEPRSVGIYFDSYRLGRVVASQSLGYFLLGYKLTMMRHHRINLPLNLLGIIGLLAINITISFVSMDKQFRWLTILSTVNIPLIVTLIYMSFRALEPYYHRWFASLIGAIAPLTYGVYLIHGIIIEAVQDFVKHASFGYVFALTTVSSMLIIFVLDKIPFVRRIFTWFEAISLRKRTYVRYNKL